MRRSEKTIRLRKKLQQRYEKDVERFKQKGLSEEYINRLARHVRRHEGKLVYRCKCEWCISNRRFSSTKESQRVDDSWDDPQE